MIERFNFYDLYGYLLPGLLSFVLIGVPFCVFPAKWPGSELGTAIVGIGLAYIAGHLLRVIGKTAFPITLFSNEYLDEGNHKFTGQFKQRILEAIKDEFQIKIDSAANK